LDCPDHNEIGVFTNVISFDQRMNRYKRYWRIFK